MTVDATTPATAELELSIIVPTYREAASLGLLVPRIAAALASVSAPSSCSSPPSIPRSLDPSIPGPLDPSIPVPPWPFPVPRSPFPYEILIVDDDSRDGTADVCAQLAQQGHPVRLITRIGERGLSSAVVRGFREARGRFLVCMDADLSHPPEALPRLLAAVQEPGVEFVIGSRYVAGGGTDEGWGFFRWLNSRVATLLARPFTSARDPMAGFFALPRGVFERAADLDPIGYKIGLELIVKCGCRAVREVPIQFANRKFGQSKLSLAEQLRYLRHLWRLARFTYRRAPAHRRE